MAINPTNRPLSATAAGVLAALLVTAISGAGVATAAGTPSPGPALTAPAPALSAALACPQGIQGARHPVLLVPGAGGDPTTVFSAGLEPVLRAKGYAACALTLPDAAFSDIQFEAEYVVAAIRMMAAKSGRPVSVVAVSQGGVVSRWALKWWPDLRSLVGDVIGVAPDNHGAGRILVASCQHPCPPATRQQLPDSRFLAALNQGDETPGRLAYSVISSATDVNVPPPSPDLQGEGDDTNTPIQAICPGREVDHGHLAYDAVAIALVLDALRHAGPARASRVSEAVCAKTYPDRVDPAEVERQIAAGNTYFGANYSRVGLTEVEPPLSEYATRVAPRPRATLRVHPRRLRAGSRARVSMLATGRARGQSWPLSGAQVEIAGRTVVTNARGLASTRVRPRCRGAVRVRLVAPGLGPVTARLPVK